MSIDWDFTSKGSDAGAVLDRLFGVADWYAQVNMLWWVSSTALIGALLAGVWSKRLELRSSPKWARRVASLGAIFLSTIVAFGLVSSVIGFRLGSSGLGACDAAGPEVCQPSGEGFIFLLEPWAVVIGTSSFVIALVAWVRYFYGPRLRRWRRRVRTLWMRRRGIARV
ncbi:hypothetical protein [Cellulosimicrobium cellulans]|uniref:hypothetical protein n=1 Tax=Cellulosimicrobium cellulans TaxID=1710 RepID=UPI00130E708E|nr:hypothetical protein [Cellulosimicrobium cellulans]